MPFASGHQPHPSKIAHSLAWGMTALFGTLLLVLYVAFARLPIR